MKLRIQSGLILLAWICGASLAVVGCGANDNYMPMQVNKKWTYRVRAGFERHTIPIRVVRELTVASTTGYELASPLGVSRIAWKSGKLVADSTVNAQFIPPIPLLVPGAKLDSKKVKQVETWHGRIIALGQEKPASAVLIEQLDTVDFGTRKVNAILATLTIRIPNGVLELQSWYQSGVGLIQQEQRTNGTRIVQLSLVSHS